MTTVLSILGARPEAVKMAPVIRELEKHPQRICSRVCVTGQHRELLDQALASFDLRPDYDLNLMKPNQSLSQLTASLFEPLDRVAREVRPDWILAQGDTTTVLAAGLVAFYNRIKFGHVEAGLRTKNRYNPFPEEINRRIADLVADAYFAPTERARLALLSEGAADSAIHVTGNTGIDALLHTAELPYLWDNGPLRHLPPNRRLVLITAHRRESFGEPFRQICSAIRELAARFAANGFHFVYPVHLNPEVRRPVFDILAGVANLSLLEPLDYLSLIHLMKLAYLILTDSGGIQEEAPSFGVPVLVMRETTERPEGIEAGVAKLIGVRQDSIVAGASQILSDPRAHDLMIATRNPYGDGKAAGRIVSVLMNPGQP